jgi:hypothetical protein
MNPLKTGLEKLTKRLVHPFKAYWLRDAPPV